MQGCPLLGGALGLGLHGAPGTGRVAGRTGEVGVFPHRTACSREALLSRRDRRMAGRPAGGIGEGPASQERDSVCPRSRKETREAGEERAGGEAEPRLRGDGRPGPDPLSVRVRASTLAFFLGQNRRVLNREMAWSGISAVPGTAGEKEAGGTHWVTDSDERRWRWPGPGEDGSVVRRGQNLRARGRLGQRPAGERGPGVARSGPGVRAAAVGRTGSCR